MAEDEQEAQRAACFSPVLEHATALAVVRRNLIRADAFLPFCAQEEPLHSGVYDDTALVTTIEHCLVARTLSGLCELAAPVVSPPVHRNQAGESAGSLMN